MSMNMTNKFNEFMEQVRYSLQYSIFETGYLVGLLIDLWVGDGLATWYLWVGFVLAAIWFVVSSTAESRDEFKDLVMEREVFMFDLLMSAFILTLIAITIRGESWWFPAMILLAAGQNLRYTYEASRWLLEERREQRRELEGRNGHTDDHM